MTLRVDPERNEVRALRQAAEWKGREVLELGCGRGRLTRRLARLGARVVALEPDADRVREARRGLPHGRWGQVQFRVGRAGRLSFPAGSFDTVVLSWSL